MRRSQRQPRFNAGGRQRGSAKPSGIAFARALEQVAPPADTKHRGRSAEHEPVAHLSYGDEIAAKEAALQSFWREHRLAGEPQALVRSPKPRGYRTSSKRRVAVRRGRMSFFLGDRPDERQRSVFVPSALEPREHAAVYRGLSKKLIEPGFRSLATHLNYLIVRGNYEERALILNVDELNAAIVRKVKLLAGAAEQLSVSSCFVYLDPSRSSYHFESRRPEAAVTFKKIAGPELLSVNHCGCRYRYHPTSFSQINQSIVPGLLESAKELLAPTGDQGLLDLYCGYGLFSHYLAPSYRQVVGVDAEGPSIRSATANTRLNPDGGNRRFIAASIDKDFVDRSLPRARGGEVVLLDPPRNGPQQGVIASIGRRAPEKVLHVFCDVDQIPPSLESWRSAGYEPGRVVPLDMFPGSANLEVLVLLNREQSKASR